MKRQKCIEIIDGTTKYCVDINRIYQVNMQELFKGGYTIVILSNCGNGGNDIIQIDFASEKKALYIYKKLCKNFKIGETFLCQ